MSGSYRFGRFELRVQERQLLADGQAVSLGARAFDVLYALVERRDRTVSKEEILDLVWAGLVVEENNLQVHVSALRKLLGANAIATIPGRGYRFCLDPSDAPAAGATPSPSHWLPAERTSFIGRVAELETCEALLHSTRLLTLTGMGGTGKTRLALAVARRALPARRDGAWFVDLAPLQQPEQLPATACAVLGVRERPGIPAIDALVEHLASREALLILDNCETALTAAAELVDALIERCVSLRVLATSRERLHVAGEQVYAVHPLGLPSPTDDPSKVSDAVSLFVDRARRAVPAFTPEQPATAQAVRRICLGLDGIPLALELAASRVAIMDVAQIAQRLDQRFRLLTGGRERPARQQTLEAVVRWSWDHLTPDDQRLLSRLSVFAGGCVLDAAVRVAGANDEMAVLDALGRLHAASLVVVVTDAGGETRYRLLETVRAFAADRLRESGDADAVRTLHLRAQLVRAEAQVGRQDVGRTLATFGAELDDVLLAHAWCNQAEDQSLAGLRLVGLLMSSFVRSGRVELGIRLTAKALEHPSTQGPGLERAGALYGLGRLRYFNGDMSGARPSLEQALALALSLNEPKLRAQVLTALADLAWPGGDLQAAKAMSHEAVTVARTLPMGDRTSQRARGSALNTYGTCLRWVGELAASQAAYSEALVLARQLDDAAGVANIAVNLVVTLLAQGCEDGVLELLREAAELELATDSPWVGKQVLRGCAAWLLHRAQWHQGLVLSGAERAVARQTGMDLTPGPQAGAQQAESLAALGPHAAAAAWEEGEALRYAAALGMARTVLEVA